MPPKVKQVKKKGGAGLEDVPADVAMLMSKNLGLKSSKAFADAVSGTARLASPGLNKRMADAQQKKLERCFEDMIDAIINHAQTLASHPKFYSEDKEYSYKRCNDEFKFIFPGGPAKMGVIWISLTEKKDTFSIGARFNEIYYRGSSKQDIMQKFKEIRLHECLDVVIKANTEVYLTHTDEAIQANPRLNFTVSEWKAVGFELQKSIHGTDLDSFCYDPVYEGYMKTLQEINRAREKLSQALEWAK